MPEPATSHAPTGQEPRVEGSEQERAPYLEALRAYASRRPARLNVPGHKGGAGADPEALEAFGQRAFELDIPPGIPGIDAGERPHPLERAQRLAAEAWGARRTWFLINGASQGNHAALLALAHRGSHVVVQRNAHSSTIDALILSGLRPVFVEPEVDDELHIAHCVTPEALERALDSAPADDVAGVVVVSPTYYGAVADVEALCAVAHARGLPVVVDEAWGAHLAFHEELPAPALALGADLVVSSTHKSVGSLTQSAMLHLSRDALIDEDVVDRCVTTVESTSPNSLLCGSLDAARRFAATSGREALTRTLERIAATRRRINEIPGLAAIGELPGRASVRALDPLRLMVDVRATGSTGFEISALLRSVCDVHVELSCDTLVVAAFGLDEPAETFERLVEGLRCVAPAADRRAAHDDFRPPPAWGRLAMTPREAFFAPHEVVPLERAAGRVAAESLAAYPPGIPNVLPGELIEPAVLDYVRTTLARGGSVRGAADRTLGTVRVVAEDHGLGDDQRA